MKNRAHVLAMFVMLPLFMTGQTYEFSVSSEPYTELANGTPLVTETWDDPDYTAPLGFVFHYYGKNVTSVTQIGEVAYPLLATTPAADTLGFFFVFGADLIDRGFADTLLQSPITYKTSGSTGNRVFTIEWKNVGFYNQYFFLGDNTDFANFQMKLYEADGTIEYHFGPSNITRPDIDYDNTGPFVGLIEKLHVESDVSYGESLLLSGLPTNPTVVNTYSAVYLNGTIPANTVYRFSRVTTAVEDPLAIIDQPYFNPNPCNDFIQVANNLQEEIIPPVLVYNSTGTLVSKEMNTQRIVTRNWIAGVYQLQFGTKTGLKTQRIAVSH